MESSESENKPYIAEMLFSIAMIWMIKAWMFMFAWNMIVPDIWGVKSLKFAEAFGCYIILRLAQQVPAGKNDTDSYTRKEFWKTISNGLAWQGVLLFMVWLVSLGLK